MRLELEPVGGQVGEVFGIDGDLLEEFPLFFNFPKVSFALVFFPSRRYESLLAEDSANGPMGAGEIEVSFHAFGPEVTDPLS